MIQLQITSSNTSLPLNLQVHAAVGYFICFLAMLGIYYNNVWEARSLPFMSTSLKMDNGSTYPITSVFDGGILNETRLHEHGIPRITGTFAFAMFMANMAIGALIAHCIVFWGGDVVKAYKNARAGMYGDRHHAHMAKHYRETPWWWYAVVLVVSFVIGIIVVTKENITLPVWGYIVSLILGFILAPFVSNTTAFISVEHLRGEVSNSRLTCRALSSTLVTVTVSPRTTCPRCWAAS